MSPTTSLGDFDAGEQATIDAGDEPADYFDQDGAPYPPACACDDLPDDMECWTCQHRRLRS